MLHNYRVCDALATCVCLTALGWALSQPCAAQGRPAHGVDPLSATAQEAIAAAEPQQGMRLTADQERALTLRQKVLERAFNDNEGNWQAYEKVLGRGRCRDLNRALFSYNLHSPIYGHDLWLRPNALDDSADVVLSAYSKMQREALEDALGIEEWWDRRWDRRRASPSSDDATTRERSYRMRVSPRLADDYVGVKLRMPYTGTTTFDHLSFQMRYDVDESRPMYFLKFDDDRRYWRLAYEPDTREFGDLVQLSVRFAW